jgi:glycosyltransferase involved in cell wall biosynthesis/peptidoglycan/xylan/chitin deacetylase (PgdA/CDA1 family)/2-polyprenyl-3-methyl-5-hydroxy-6-metoxy-1,4-benzoquinol methylase
VTFVIPAYNAESTIERTLNSVTAQTVGWWEAIIVDDGSGDDTFAISEARAGKDRRIKVLRQENAGPSAARNRGIEQACTDWLVFLDSDDTIEPIFLERMFGALDAAPSATAACCGYCRVDPHGHVVARHAAPPMNEGPVPICVERPPTTIHALVVRRRDVLDVGSFDTELVTNEDWDLWIRLARAGTRFVVVPLEMAYYWNSSRSLTKDVVRMIRDTGTVRRRCVGPDPRIKEPLPEYADGINVEDIHLAQLGSALWNAGVALASGRDATALLDELEYPESFVPFDHWMVHVVHAGMLMEVPDGNPGLIAHWPKVEHHLIKFLGCYERKAKLTGFCYVFTKALERELYRVSRSNQILVLTYSMCVPIRLSTLVHGIKVPAHIDTAVFKIRWLRPRRLFMFDVPVLADMSAADVRRSLLIRLRTLVESAVDRFSVTRRLALQVPRVRASLARRLRLDRGSPTNAVPPLDDEVKALIEAERAAAVIASPKLTRPVLGPPEAVPNASSNRYAEWDEIYRAADPWNYGNAYEQLKYERTLAICPDLSQQRVLELGCSEGRFTVLLSEKAGFVRAIDVSKVALDRAQARCAGRSNVEFLNSDFFDEPLVGKWDVIFCSEVLYYLDCRTRLDDLVSKIVAAITQGGYFVHATGYQVVDNPRRTGFDTGVPFGAEAIAAALRRLGLTHVRSITTELYQIDLFRCAAERVIASTPEILSLELNTDLDAAVERNVVWKGAVKTRADADKKRALRVPALMYHRVADTGPDRLARWRVTPAELQHQLRFLRRRGFRSISVDDWELARQGGSLPGRPILLTFDDGYLDFYETVWPIIERSGFSAHVFVVTDKVGQTSDWDVAPAPLMTWDHIAELASQGVTFGSHLCSHTPVTHLNSRDLLGEAVRSRETLEQVLKRPIRTIAVPYGITDARMAPIAAWAGYTRLFLDDYGPSPLWRSPFWTSRIEVKGDYDIDKFVASLSMDIEMPDAGDVL